MANDIILNGNNHNYHGGETHRIDDDVDNIVGKYFRTKTIISQRVEEYDNTRDVKGYSESSISRKRVVRSELPEGITLLAVKCNFFDDTLHSVVFANHPAHESKFALSFMSEEFFAYFEPVDGEAIRAQEIAEVNNRILEIQAAMANPANYTPPPALSFQNTGSLTGHDLVVAQQETMKQHAVALSTHAEKQMMTLQSYQKDIQDQALLLTNFFQEKAQAAQASVSEHLNKANDILAGIDTMSAFLGNSVSIMQLTAGKNAPAGEKLHLYQDKLYLDEELASAGIENGFDFKIIDDLGGFLSANNQIIERLIPAQLGCVLVQFRRTEKDYFGHKDYEYENKLENVENFRIYLIVRNGENIYLVDGDGVFNYMKYLFPSQKEMDDAFKMGGDVIEQRHLTYVHAKRVFEQKSNDYKKVLLLIWGLSENHNLFGNFYDSNKYSNWYSPEFQMENLHYVYDGENTLEEVRDSFWTWAKRQNSKIKENSTVVVNLNAFINKDSAPSCYTKEADPYNRVQEYHAPEKFSVEMVTKYKGELVIRFKATPLYFNRKLKDKTVTLYLKHLENVENNNIICIDDANLTDLAYFLNSRKQRREYLAYYNAFKLIYDTVSERKGIEQSVIQKAYECINASHSEISNESIEESLNKALVLWRQNYGVSVVNVNKWNEKNNKKLIEMANMLNPEMDYAKNLFNEIKVSYPDISLIEIRMLHDGKIIAYREILEDNEVKKIDDKYVIASEVSINADKVVLSNDKITYAYNPIFNDPRHSRKVVISSHYKSVNEVTIYSDEELAEKYNAYIHTKNNEYSLVKDVIKRIKVDAYKNFYEQNKANKYDVIDDIMIFIQDNGHRSIHYPDPVYLQPLGIVKLENNDINLKEYPVMVLCKKDNVLNTLLNRNEATNKYVRKTFNKMFRNPEDRFKKAETLKEGELVLASLDVFKNETDLFHEHDAYMTLKGVSSSHKDIVYDTIESELNERMQSLNMLKKGENEAVSIYYNFPHNKLLAEGMFEMLKESTKL